MQAYAVYTLMLTALLLHSYARMQSYFSGPSRYEKYAKQLDREIKEERLRRMLAEHSLEGFKVEVATLLPEALKNKMDKEEGYPLRQLASVVTQPRDLKLMNQAAELSFEQGKSYFRRKNFAAAVAQFTNFIERHSYSVHVTEAYFLMAEAQYQMQEYTECIKTVEKMVQLFPENELTGYALLRMGKIFEINHRPSESIEIYKTVLRSFPYRDLASQARLSLGAVEL